MKSTHFKNRLLNSIPGGAHVHSKGLDQFPANAPVISSQTKGCYLFDEKGVKFLDYGMALRSVTIGYGEQSINQGAIACLNKGNTSTLPTIVELMAAERLIDMIDSIEMVKFTKDGSTATTAAIKLARAYTGKNMIACCQEQPFFSYDDWFIGTTTGNRGCLQESYTKTKKFEYNNIASLETLFDKYPNQFAAVILEPALSILEPESDFLHKLRSLCDKKNVILIFDEMITGFRWHLKGAQHYYQVSPDLCTFGKGMANGFSVSALGGKKDIMALGNIDLPPEQRVFFLSATHGAEMSGLGAFLATMDFYEKNPVISSLWDYGKHLKDIINSISKEYGLSDHFYAYGLDCLPYYVAKDAKGNWSKQFTLLFQQEMIKQGIIIRNIAICYRHSDVELDLTKAALHQSLEIYKKALNDGVELYLITAES